MQEMICKMWQDDDGQDLIEYALIAGLISLVCWVAIQTAGGTISAVWTSVTTALGAAGTASSGTGTAG